MKQREQILLIIFSLFLITCNSNSVKEEVTNEDSVNIEEPVVKKEAIKEEPVIVEKSVVEKEVIKEKPVIVEKSVVEKEVIKEKPVIVEKPVVKEKKIKKEPVIQDKEQFTDQRDGQTYKTVKIGSQVWMAVNLNYKSSNSYCYDSNSSSCDAYGRLYSWEVANNACPAGWHLPSKTEWELLINYYGGKKVAGGKIKSSQYWKPPNKGVNGSSDFSALPGGRRNISGAFRHLNKDGYYWSSTNTGKASSWAVGLYFNHSDVNPFTDNQANGFSVRCLKD